MLLPPYHKPILYSIADKIKKSGQGGHILIFWQKRRHNKGSQGEQAHFQECWSYPANLSVPCILPLLPDQKKNLLYPLDHICPITNDAHSVVSQLTQLLSEGAYREKTEEGQWVYFYLELE